MAKLAQVTRETRLIGKVAGILAIALTAIYFVIFGAGIIKNTFFPKPPPPPDVKYGKLPHLSFSLQGTAPGNYIINTVSGILPTIDTDRLSIYKIKKPESNILALQALKPRIAQLGFLGAETEISDTKYQWGTGTVLLYNIFNNNFDLTSGFLNNAYAIPLNQLPTTHDQFTNTVSNFLNILKLDTTDIDFKKSPIKYFDMNGTTMNLVTKASDAQIARIDVFQKDIALDPTQQFNFNGIPVTAMPLYYPIPDQSTMNFILAPDGSGGLKVVEAHYIHQYIDLDSHSTYPIKTATQAYQDLKKGDGIISNPSESQTVNITSVSVGYFLGPNQDYLLPIYIFSNEKDFTAYVSALANSTQ